MKTLTTSSICVAILLTISGTVSHASSYASDIVASSEQITSGDIGPSINALNIDFQKKDIRKEDVRALNGYAGQYYEVINAGLRQENLNKLSAMSARICDIDSLIERFPIAVSKLTVYRGHSYLPSGSEKTGYEFIDKAFISTSISKKVALRFVKNKEVRVLDVIDVPTKLIPSFWVHPTSPIKDEYEVLLARNVKFKVVTVEIEKSLFSAPLIIRRLIPIGRVPTSQQAQETLQCHP